MKPQHAWRVALLIAGLAPIAQLSHAAARGDVYGGISGGASIPEGRLADELDSGFAVGASFDAWYTRSDAAGLDFTFNRFGRKAGSDQASDHTNVAQLGLHDRRFVGSGRLQPFVMLGASMFSTPGQVNFGAEGGLGVSTQLTSIVQFRIEGVGHDYWIDRSPRPYVTVAASLLVRGADAW
ncbi:MAG TPA: hypothetical protein VFK69_01330 [Candidatus Eisenbacteria bacterium]|nr:hypothetical protein [Candidatus Eisenbacteria bacterium]